MPQAAVPNKNRIIRSYPIIKYGEWAEGAILDLVAGELDAEIGADPTPFAGFAAHDVELVNDIYDGKAMLFVAGPGSTFWLEGTRDPLQSDEGKQYDIVLSGGVAIVDATSSAQPRLYVESADLIRNLWEVSVVAAHRRYQ
jgi:hypothetical protein